ncbi:MAG: hypothetical protein ACXACD_20640 [Candidatus Thorarchaeota archaeon]|jgi:hypothetical protein
MSEDFNLGKAPWEIDFDSIPIKREDDVSKYSRVSVGKVQFPKVCLSCGVTTGDFHEFHDKISASEIHRGSWYVSGYYYREFTRYVNAIFFMCQNCWESTRNEDSAVLEGVKEKEKTFKKLWTIILSVTLGLWVLVLLLFSIHPLILVIASLPLATITGFWQSSRMESKIQFMRFQSPSADLIKLDLEWSFWIVNRGYLSAFKALNPKLKIIPANLEGGRVDSRPFLHLQVFGKWFFVMLIISVVLMIISLVV